MTERIEFLGTTIKQNEDGVTYEDTGTLFSCWAEVLNTPNREFRDPTTKVGYRKNSPNFAIRFVAQRPIDSTWKIKWRGDTFEITGIDEDFQKRDITKIECKEVE